MAKRPRPPVGLREAVAWVMDNYEAIVGEDANGRTVYYWDRELTPCPGNAAKSYMKFAARNPTAFFQQVAPKFLGDEEAVSEEDATHDRKLVNTIRGVLRRFTETTPAPKGDGRVGSKKNQSPAEDKTPSEAAEGQTD